MGDRDASTFRAASWRRCRLDGGRIGRTAHTGIGADARTSYRSGSSPGSRGEPRSRTRIVASRRSAWGLPQRTERRGSTGGGARLPSAAPGRARGHDGAAPLARSRHRLRRHRRNPPPVLDTEHARHPRLPSRVASRGVQRRTVGDGDRAVGVGHFPCPSDVPQLPGSGVGGGATLRRCIREAAAPRSRRAHLVRDSAESPTSLPNADRRRR